MLLEAICVKAAAIRVVINEQAQIIIKIINYIMVRYHSGSGNFMPTLRNIFEFFCTFAESACNVFRNLAPKTIHIIATAKVIIAYTTNMAMNNATMRITCAQRMTSTSIAVKITPPAMNGRHNFFDQARDTDDTRDVSSNLSKNDTCQSETRLV